jgi:hypothetical protein
MNMRPKIEQVKAKVQAEIDAAQTALDRANARMAKIQSAEAALNDLAEEFGGDETPTPPAAKKTTTKPKATVKKAKKKVAKKSQRRARRTLRLVEPRLPVASAPRSRKRSSPCWASAP